MLALYHGANSVCSVKVRIVLAEKGLEWNSRPVDLPKGEHLAEAYLKINPRAVGGDARQNPGAQDARPDGAWRGVDFRSGGFSAAAADVRRNGSGA